MLASDYVITVFGQALWWHPMHDQDAGHRWLREVFDKVARELSTG